MRGREYRACRMIVDANIAVYWTTETPFSSNAEIYLERQDLLAPSLLRLEVASALLRERARGRISQEVLRSGMQLVETAIGHFADDGPLLPTAIDIAMAENHKIYDCLYLALALERGEPLATADRRMAEIARSLSLETELIEPSL